MTSQPKPLVIWMFVDGKPGHQNQSEGLVAALGRLTDVQVMRLPALPFWKTLFNKLFSKTHGLDFAPKPDLLIGAGHATHPALVLMQWFYGGRSIVLMKPSLPLFLFDLCLMPEHDGYSSSSKVIMTKGVLNRIEPKGMNQINKGLLLIGGPSKHYGWDEDEVIKKITTILAAMPQIQWICTDSRRTPDSTARMLFELEGDNYEFISHKAVKPEWLPEKLDESYYAWVTEDSVSMVYEALTAGNHVGLIEGVKKTQSRVSRGVGGLVENNYVKPYQCWLIDEKLDDTQTMMSEAERCANQVVERWKIAS